MKLNKTPRLILLTIFIVLSSVACPQQKAPTAAEIIARIQKETKVPWGMTQLPWQARIIQSMLKKRNILKIITLSSGDFMIIST